MQDTYLLDKEYTASHPVYKVWQGEIHLMQSFTPATKTIDFSFDIHTSGEYQPPTSGHFVPKGEKIRFRIKSSPALWDKMSRSGRLVLSGGVYVKVYSLSNK